MTEPKTLEQVERASKRQLWTMKVLAVVSWLTFFVLLVVLVMRKGMHRSQNDIQVEQLAIVTLHLIEPKPRDQAVLEEQFRAALPTAFRLMELTRDFLDAKSKETDTKHKQP